MTKGKSSMLWHHVIVCGKGEVDVIGNVKGESAMWHSLGKGNVKGEGAMWRSLVKGNAFEYDSVDELGV